MGGFVDYLRMLMGWWSRTPPPTDIGPCRVEDYGSFQSGAKDVCTFSAGVVDFGTHCAGAQDVCTSS